MPSKPRPQFYALLDPNHKTYMWMEQLLTELQSRGIKGNKAKYFSIKHKVARTLRNLNLDRSLPGNHQNKTPYIVPITWGRIDRAFPRYLNHPIIPIINDCWEPQFSQWERLLRQHKFDVCFFTARIAGQVLSERVGGLDWVWLPEAIEPSICDPSKPLAERTVDLAEFGRTIPVVYEKCAPMFKQRGYTMKAAPNGQWVVKTNKEFYELLANTRLASCFPKTMTQFEGPLAAGIVETVTYRYFEVMASKTLPYGYCPAELIDLFGYNPCIQADLSDPAGQVDDILQNIGDYQELADRNYQRLLEVGTWTYRVGQMLDVLRERGYDIP